MVRQKIAAIVWTIDPEGKRRFLLRHNKPFNGYEDEWTITFGGVEKDESIKEAAEREVYEEFSIKEREDTVDLNYKIVLDSKGGKTDIHFFAIKIISLDIPIVLNEESIGYDWMKLEDAMSIMKHDDEKKAFELIK